MYVIEIKNGLKHEVEVNPIENIDFKSVTKKEYFFNWKLEKEYEIYKINILDQSKILGLVSIERIPDEFRIHIRLLSVSSDNKGKKKLYDRIVGNLLTYIAKLAIKDYAELACVSLKPKGKVAQHYIDKYSMNITGATLSLELKNIFGLLNTYDIEK